MYADLHIHSWFTDGTLSPIEVTEKARNQDITLISICDHNSIDSYTETENLINSCDVKIIKGVEVTSAMDDMEYHVLAYGFDMQNKALNELFQYNRNVNIDMGTNLIGKIAMDYPSVSLKEFSTYERDRRNGGWDSIDYLRSKGLVTDWQSYSQFVRNYASPLEKDFLHPEEVIKTIHDAEGYAILAHLCHHIEPNTSDHEKKAIRFFNMGIDGFECFYPLNSSELTEYLVGFCHEHDLMITAGSDDHGGFIGAPEDVYHIGAVRVRIEQLKLKNLIDSSK